MGLMPVIQALLALLKHFTEDVWDQGIFSCSSTFSESK